MTTVTIEPDEATEYAIHLAEGAVPVDLAASQTYYPDSDLVVGYTFWWDAVLAVDGVVKHVDAAAATVTIEGERGYGFGGFGAGGYGERA